MIDVKLIVEKTDFVKSALLKRMKPEELDLESIVILYNQKKEKQAEFEKVRTEQNSFNDKMSQVQKGSEEFKLMLVELKELAAKVKNLEEEARKIDEELTSKVEVLPNLPDDDLLAGEKENNKVVKEFGTQPKFDFEIKDHVELGTKLDILDFERAAKMGGAQMSMYKGDGALLEFALINFFIKEHVTDGYTMIIPPHLLTEQSAYTAGQLPKFKDDVYWVQDGNCLLPTAETALANMYRDEILDEKDLPKKLFAYTPCYRREAGSYRANERGLMRMHQFNKVEMFQYTTDEGSNVAFDELVEKACKLVEKLGLHFRVSKLAAGDCSAGMARTYDIEVFLPFQKTYYEVSSVSNARDYQTRRGNMRYRPSDGSKPRLMHSLNGSGLATSRLMVALMESYQNADGSITVPEVLRAYVGKDRIASK
jgi:seryl-tRNA synthetase